MGGAGGAWSAFAQTTQPVVLRVTGERREVNGATQVPRGLFGVHATKLDPKMVDEWGIESVRLILHGPNGKPVVPGARGDVPANIKDVVECFYDRYQPAPLLTDKNWRENLEKLGRTYGENAKGAERTHYVEFYNEPFLNWATRPGVNYDPRFFEEKDRVVGGPVTLKGADRPTEFLVWAKRLIGVDAKTGALDYLSAGYAPTVIEEPATQPGAKPTTRPVREGDTYIFRGKREMKFVETWWAKDPTQKSYYSGKQNSLWYRQMLVPFAKSLKAANRDVQLAAGWGFHISSGGWDAWHTLYKPIIDDAHEWVDALHEHHYGGDTRMVAGTYETAWAYAKSTYNKELKFWNTEAGGFLDPQRPDTPARPQLEYKNPTEQYGRFIYTVRDIVHLIDVMPDKAIHRASHEAQESSDGFAFRLLKPLRGELLTTTSSDPRVWVVATAPSEKTWCVVVFNDRPTEVQFDLTTLGQLRASQTVVIEDAGLVRTPVALEQHNRGYAGLLKPKSVQQFVFDVPAQAPRGVIREQQVPASGVLHELAAGKPLMLEIALTPEQLAGVTGARLRLVQQNLARRVDVKFNGEPLAVEPTQSWLHEQPLEVKSLRAKNTLQFTLREGVADKVTINAASIVLVTKK